MPWQFILKSFQIKMNLHTFKDAVTDKRQALANDIEDDDDDDDGVGKLAEEVEGEEEEGVDKVVASCCCFLLSTN